MEYLKSLSPSGVDAEFRLLTIDNDYHDLKLAIDFLDHHLQTGCNFEITQAFLNLFLKVKSVSCSYQT